MCQLLMWHIVVPKSMLGGSFPCYSIGQNKCNVLYHADNWKNFVCTADLCKILLTAQWNTNVINNFFYLSSSAVGQAATTMFLHRILFLAAAWASPHESPISCSSVTVFCHVVFGRPGFLLPGGLHLTANLGVLSYTIDWCACSLLSGMEARPRDDCPWRVTAARLLHYNQ